VKAAGGGGGRGIKLARYGEELKGLLSLARSEAGAAFGDERLYLERFIAAARHVEVQIAADEHGAVVHLGERDCSVQRRYQKLIEEAPAPALEASTRDAIRDAAVRFARAIGYRNVGTVEFVVDSDTGEHYFLEINCRIQVEHPVTEAVTGRDLVALQLQLADGEALGFAQDDVTVEGHAVECRLNAEDVARGFLPTPGTLSLFSVPELPGLRVDTHCHPGAVVPPYYDSLLAKLIAHADDRESALDVLIEALEDLDVEGVETNRTLLISVLGHDDFRRGAVTTDWLARAIV
ncbi:MAG: acetyl-CoA carboxylase biotin carboxylase subunit, partial [Solirubrobacteraceae bacterium]